MQKPKSRVGPANRRLSTLAPTLTRAVKPLTATACLLGLFAAISLPASAKTLCELRLECGQAITLSQNPSGVGIDIYQIATCFGYIEAHLDLTPPLFCLPSDLAMGAIAELLLHETRAYNANANASVALTEGFHVSAPCPESAH